MRAISLPGVFGPQLFRNPGGVASIGADLLLDGETDGMASDFTESTGVGYVSVKDVATPANVVSNVAADAWWSNAGTSPKVVRGSDGVLKWSPHNLLQQSQTLDNVYWGVAARFTIAANDTTAPDSTLTAEKGTETTDNGTHRIQANGTSNALTALVGATYTASIYFKKGTRDWAWISINRDGPGASTQFFNINTGVLGTQSDSGTPHTFVTSAITSVGSGWYRCSLSIRATDASFTLFYGVASADGTNSYAGSTSENIYLWGAQVNRGTVPTAYLATTTAARYGLAIDYANSSYGLLVEPAATNLAIRSQEFDNTSPWTVAGGSVTANNIAAPDGTTTADLFTGSGSTAHDIAGSGTGGGALASGVTCTSSFYVKNGTANYIYVRTSGLADHWVTAVFDLTASPTQASQTAVGATSGTLTSTRAEALANGWYRLIVTAVSSAGSNGYISVGIAPAATGVTFTTTGRPDNFASTATFYVWGAQAETGTVATSPIPSFSASVTRAADAPNNVLTAVPHDAAEWSVFAQFRSKGIDTANGSTFVSLDDATTNERSQLIASNTTRIQWLMFDGAVSQAQIDSGVDATANAAFKAAARAAANDFAIAVDGDATPVTDTSGTMPTVTSVRLGYRHGLSRFVNGWIYKVVLLPRLYTDSELTAVTTP